MLRLLTFAALAFTLILTGCESDGREEPGAGVLGIDLLEPQEFVTQAASGGMYEVQSAKLALNQGAGEPVRSTALELATEHAQQNEQLRQIAVGQGLAVPAEMLPRHRQMLQSLQDANDASFVGRFHDQQIQAHEEAIQLYERAARELENEPLRNFAQQSLPALRDHLGDLRQHSHGTRP
jgi:putative membrane protein